jgi:L-lactate dehydrogenase complex protein LldE
MRVQLLLTCLCDAFYGEVGIATVRVLEAAGCEVLFPAGQTCCGQPAFNAGAWQEARPAADRVRSVFDPDLPVVAPSSSCTAMLRHGYSLLHQKAPVCYEVGEFLVDQLGVASWPLRKPHIKRRRRIALHEACHERTLRQGAATRETSAAALLLASIPGAEVLDLPHAEQCCGFGGAFSVTHPSISSGIGERKLRTLLDSGATDFVTTDMGCAMHLNGLLKRSGSPCRLRHYAELLAEEIQ